MQHSQARFAITASVLAGIVAFAGGCARGQPRAAMAAGTIPSVDESMNVPALSSSDIRQLRGMSDANILNHLATSDSLEIAMAQLAVRRSGNDEVVSLAHHIIADHSRSLNSDRMISTGLAIPMQMMPGDTSGMLLFHTLDSLDAAGPTARFNAEYVRSQIALHQRMLAELETLQAVAHDRNVRQQIANDIPVVESHLRLAQQVANDLGYPASGAD